MNQDHSGGDRILGVVPAVVVDNKDPAGRYRVKVMFPQWLCASSKYTANADKEDFLSSWARVSTWMAGPDRGAFCLPEVDDEVLVCFENGDIRFPYVVGSLWNGVDAPTHRNNDQDGKNGYRSIRSRSGHTLTFVDGGKDGSEEKIILQTETAVGEMDETDPDARAGHYVVLDKGKEKIEIRDQSKGLTIRLDSASGEILIETTAGNLTLKASETVSIECKKLEINAETEINAQAGTTATLKASNQMTLDGGGTLVGKAGMIKLN